MSTPRVSPTSLYNLRQMAAEEAEYGKAGDWRGHGAIDELCIVDALDRVNDGWTLTDVGRALLAEEDREIERKARRRAWMIGQ